MKYAINVTDLSEVLRREQRAAELRKRYEMQPRKVPSEHLIATSREDREGAGILRKLIPRIEPVMWDDATMVLRVTIPADLMMQLELWGSDNEDLEDAHDLEAWFYYREAV